MSGPTRQRSLKEKLHGIGFSWQSRKSESCSHKELQSNVLPQNPKSRSLDGHGYVNPLETSRLHSADQVLKPNLQHGNYSTGLSSSLPLTSLLQPKPPDKLEKESQITESLSPVEKRTVCRTMTQPPDTFEYVVNAKDTLTGIAARFDTTPSELTNLNRLTSRLIFPGQVLYIPEKSGQNENKPLLEEATGGLPYSERSSPKPGHVERVKSPIEELVVSTTVVLDANKCGTKLGAVSIKHSVPTTSKELDKECLEKFLKIDARHITDGQGVVSGVLLVTPNALMFDPNVSDPLVLEHGAESYGVIVPMEMVFRAALYHDIAHMRVKHIPEWSHKLPKPDVYHSSLSIPVSKDSHVQESDVIGSKQYEGFETVVIEQKKAGETEFSSNLNVTKIESEAEELENVGIEKSFQDIPEGLTGKDFDQEVAEAFTHKNVQHELIERKRPASVDSCQFLKKEEVACNLGICKKLTQKDNIKSKSATDNFPRADVVDDSGTLIMPHNDKSLHNLVTRQHSASPHSVVESRREKMIKRLSYPMESLSSCTESISKLISSSPKHFVNFSSGLFVWSSEDTKVKDVSTMNITNKIPVHEKEIVQSEISFGAKGTESQQQRSTDIPVVGYKNMVEDKPELFYSLDKLIPRQARPPDDPPLYLCLRIGRPRDKKFTSATTVFSYGKKQIRSEYWFSIPRHRVDDLYRYFHCWTPDRYGDVNAIEPEDIGFDPINSDEEQDFPDDSDNLFGDEIDGKKGKRPGPLDLLKLVEEHFGTEMSPSDWEVVSMSEAQKPQEIDPAELPLVELLEESDILTEKHCKELAQHLPPRAEGYPWTLIYSSSKHGFSLKTLYREMLKFETPVILVIADTEGTVFGAMTSCSLKISEHFYGTGESFLFSFSPELKCYHWTGNNIYFIKGNKDSLAIGAGDGQFGLWLDGDLFHGRSHKCKTYENETLSTCEDFVVKAIEAWGFE
ncbi:oxidation resistance protein 1-like isoform X2 [Tachypleus tridentatus]|uniref:oxidation resistance protein 1-like isoform X2 n=1 Tax=Tachypleus tridentatus TaxID=6853 RepID=UPI003FD5C6D8